MGPNQVSRGGGDRLDAFNSILDRQLGHSPTQSIEMLKASRSG
ncbi:hypothetical protein SAMN05421759_11453 [Roseivivax lentus]|uniref:Uncharacterized protein n=1 Tax=Roseivivax lentus TaxID=633194 RepID=A0A1N7PC07_9RHOB|nr:hypothetical protein [Roseivivax lentus]SIT08037.1 hypothetical protein SAMN05421759_11453 [Roseivivax lentus]